MNPVATDAATCSCVATDQYSAQYVEQVCHTSTCLTTLVQQLAGSIYIHDWTHLIRTNISTIVSNMSYQYLDMDNTILFTENLKSCHDANFGITGNTGGCHYWKTPVLPVIVVFMTTLVSDHMITSTSNFLQVVAKLAPWQLSGFSATYLSQC